MEREFELFEKLFAELGELFVHFVAIVRTGEEHHFDFVELVQAEKTAGVLTVGTCFTAEASGIPADALRKFVCWNHFVCIEVRERNF